MTLVLDAGPVVALHDRRDRLQGSVERVIRAEPGRLVLPAPVSAEVDYLLGRRLGQASRRAFLTDLAAGRYAVECLQAEDYRTIAQLDAAYAALSVGLADLSVVVLAARFETRRILTFDQRHFRTLRPLDGGAFTLLPADSFRRSPVS